MNYKGYTARIEYSDEDGCFVGRIAGITDIVGFHGDSVNELRSAFEEAVDDYLATYQKLGQKPQRPFSGKFNLRIPPELHAKASIQAETSGKSLNQWVSEAIDEALGSGKR